MATPVANIATVVIATAVHPKRELGWACISFLSEATTRIFNSSEKRLARILLLLAHFGKEGVPETLIPKISQETLAEMVGTTG